MVHSILSNFFQSVMLLKSYALAVSLTDVGQYPLPSRDSVEIVFDDNSNLTVQYTAFVSVSGTNNLRPVLALQQDLKKLINLAKEQADFKQFLYTDSDSPLYAQLLGKRRRRRRQADIYEQKPKGMLIDIVLGEMYICECYC